MRITNIVLTIIFLLMICNFMPAQNLKEDIVGKYETEDAELFITEDQYYTLRTIELGENGKPTLVGYAGTWEIKNDTLKMSGIIFKKIKIVYIDNELKYLQTPTKKYFKQ